MLCHGAWHGSPYVHLVRGFGRVNHEERRDRIWVASRIGAHILERRPDTILYVIEKLARPALGTAPGLAFLEDEYLIVPEQALAAYNRAHLDREGA